jgi:8-oxo-dGTP pyrophosphatase MutT (NUDIX family)
MSLKIKGNIKMRKEASLSIIENVKNNTVLMIKHKRGINNGYVNFPGGKKEPNETMVDCVIRETFEETGLKISNPKKVGYIEFPTMDFYVTIFKSTEYEGTLSNNPEEVDAFWQNIKDIPYDKMRTADADFVPLVMAGNEVNKQYFYDEQFNLVKIVDLSR